MQMADTLLIPARMQSAGFSIEQIRAGVGLMGMAMPGTSFLTSSLWLCQRA